MKTARETSVTGLILAGGAGRRVSGQDKGLLDYRGAPLVEHVVTRLRPQVNHLLISCNRNHSAYRRYAETIATDLRGGFQGPLAGIEAALPLLQTDIVVIAPCDAPLIPPDLVSRLVMPLSAGTDACELCYAHDGQRDQYLFAAGRVTHLATLSDFLDSGGRAVRDWFSLQRAIPIDFSDQREAFSNHNTLRSINPGDRA
ncbi:MAG: molybdenum cofactor guanylyltransferase MobA [Halioglobus sp.]